MSVFGQVPSRAFRVEWDQNADNYGWDHRTAHHEAPVQAKSNAVIRNLNHSVKSSHVPGTSFGTITHEIEGEISDISNHDAKGCPHLPLHDQGTSHFWWCTLGSKDGLSITMSVLCNSKILRYEIVKNENIRVVADLGPIPRPKANRAMNICHQVSTRRNKSAHGSLLETSLNFLTCKGLPETSNRRNNTSGEHSASTAKPSIHRLC